MTDNTYKPGFHKLIHHQDHLKKLEKREIVSPLHISVFPTNFCQLKCKYCCFGKTKRTKEELSYDDFILAVDVLTKYGLKALEFSGGGDPLLWSQFDKAVEYSHKKGLSLSLVTNGLGLENHPSQIYNMFSWIRISIQSAKYISNINMEVIPENVKTSFSFIVYDEEDVRELEKIHKISSEKNIIVRVAPDRPCTKLWEWTVEEKTKSLGAPFLFFKKERGSPLGCYMLWIRAALDWKGNFLPCPSIELSPEYFGKIPDTFGVCKAKDLEEWLLNNPIRDLGYRCSFCNCGKDTNDFIHLLLQKVEDINFV